MQPYHIIIKSYRKLPKESQHYILAIHQPVPHCFSHSVLVITNHSLIKVKFRNDALEDIYYLNVIANKIKQKKGFANFWEKFLENFVAGKMFPFTEKISRKR